MKATARDMRYHLKSVMASVQRGEEVLITNRGKVRARLVPAGEGDAPGVHAGSGFVGMWRERDDLVDVRAYVRLLREGRPA